MDELINVFLSLDLMLLPPQSASGDGGWIADWFIHLPPPSSATAQS